MTKAYQFDTGEGSYIIFANKRSYAKKVAYYLSEENIGWIEISVTRLPKLDYLDKPDGYVIDWYDQDERRAVVEAYCWTCSYDDICYEECSSCKSNDICEKGQEVIENWRK